MNFVDSIIKKRDGGKLTKEEIAFFVKGVTDGTLPDYQISALLMAIFLKGMDTEETAQLTMEMAHSGGMFWTSPLWKAARWISTAQAVLRIPQR